MTFPDTKFDDVSEFLDAYADRYRRAVAGIDRDSLARAAEVLEDCFQAGNVLYVCGNGGSAAISDSFVCDHSKLIQTDTNLLPRVVSLSANTPMMTAIANDLSYDDVFVYQLATLARHGDVLLTVSASGNSENIVRASKWARDNDLEVVAFTGFEGGRSAELATVQLHVEADNYGVIEDVFQTLMHALAQFIRQRRMSEGLIANRKF